MSREIILQAFRHFTYVTAHSDSPSFPLLHLRHSSFSNPSFTFPTSQALYLGLRHLASRPCNLVKCFLVDLITCKYLRLSRSWLLISSRDSSQVRILNSKLSATKHSAIIIRECRRPKRQSCSQQIEQNLGHNITMTATQLVLFCHWLDNSLLKFLPW